MSSKPRVFMDVRIGTTVAGRMVFELFNDIVPRTAENFRCLCTGEKGLAKRSRKPLHFRNTIFHRVIKGFMAQGGDFENADGTGGESIYGPNMRDENFVHKHIGPGMLSMANAGKNTNGSQFFITFRSTPHLNARHVVFGRIIQGMEVLQLIEKTQTARGDRPLNEIVVIDCGEVGKSSGGGSAVAVGESAPSIDVSADSGSVGVKRKANDDNDDRDDNAAEGEEEEEKEVPQPTEEELSNMNTRQRKLFELRLRMNKARKNNKREVKEEVSRLSSGDPTKTSKKKEYLRGAKDWKKKLEDSGGDAAQPWLYETAELVEKKDKKTAKKNANQNYGWNVFNQDAQYNSYMKRVKKARKTEDLNAADINDLNYFEQHEPSEIDVDRMVKELEETQKRRMKFSRRRTHNESKDIDYINDRNAIFNKKVARAYDKYTAEIKSNLERGTAL